VATDAITVQSRALESALAKYESKKGELYDPDGRPIYSLEQHASRLEALLSELDEAVQAAKTVADREIEKSKRELDLLGADPSGRLSSDELAAATRRMRIFREDFETLSLEQLTLRARAAVASKDRAEQYLALRYGRRRVDAELARARDGQSTPMSRRGLTELAHAIDELGARFSNDAGRDAIQQRIYAAQELQVQAARVRAQADGRLHQATDIRNYW
jgi:hypothetical protein